MDILKGAIIDEVGCVMGVTLEGIGDHIFKVWKWHLMHEQYVLVHFYFNILSLCIPWGFNEGGLLNLPLGAQYISKLLSSHCGFGLFENIIS